MHQIKLPSRYEQIEKGFRGRLRPNKSLIDKTQRALKSCRIQGGIRFLPVFGRSGGGKTSAALELGTHLPDVGVITLDAAEIIDRNAIKNKIQRFLKLNKGRFPVLVIDQYEEEVAQKENIPTQFIEAISLLDRGELKDTPALFLWLTTSQAFRDSLSAAARRNERLLLDDRFELAGPEREEWPSIIEELFEFHNPGEQLADYQILANRLHLISVDSPTIGHAIGEVAAELSDHIEPLHDLSKYSVYMIWPVSDGTRLQRIQQFTEPRQGYKLNWNAWYRQMAGVLKNAPLNELNKARLYFDLRIIPIQVADLHMLFRNLDDVEPELGSSYLDQFRRTHFYSILSGSWTPETYTPMRERPESRRAEEARAWYLESTQYPTKIGRRLAHVLRACDFVAEYERDIESPSSRVRADVLVKGRSTEPENIIIELKAFAPDGTMPSTICEQARITMRRHAELLGLLKK